MSVQVSDTRAVISTADDNTGGTWTGGGGGFIATPSVEGGLSWVGTINEGTDQLYFTTGGAAFNADNQMVYVWSDNFAVQNVWDFPADPPNAMYLGDGTNEISFMMAGSDRKVFSHLEGQDWNWDCLLLDMSKAAEVNAAGHTIERVGNFAALDSSSLTIFGTDLTTLSKGVGGGVNVAIDIIRIGNDGLVITSGSSADPGLFEQIVAEDRSIASLKAHGIIRTYTTGIYGIQGPLTFGTPTAAGSWFEDSNVTLAFEARDVADDKYYLRVTGSAVADTTFILQNSSITTAGPYVTLNFSGSSNTSYIRKLELIGNTFSNLGNPVYFGNNYSSSFHTASNNTFANCGIITAGNTVFDGNTIQTGKNHSGSLLLDSSSAAYLDEQTDNMSNLSFIASGTTGHAIYITEAAATYSFSGFSFSGFGADGTAAASIYNNSGGSVLINLLGTTTPTIRNGTSATTTLSSPATLTLTGMVSGTEVTITSGSDSTVLYHKEDVGFDGEAAYPYTVGGLIVDILIFHLDYDPNLSSIFNYTLLTEDASIPIQQITDRIYYNPV